MSKMSMCVCVKNSNAHKVWLKSINKKYASRMPKPLVNTSAAYMEAYTQHKLKKWERKHPKPIRFEGIQLDMFETKFAVPWKESRTKELERIRSFVASVYDKLALIGRYRTPEGKYIETGIMYVKRGKVLSKPYKSINDIPANNKTLRKLIKTNISDNLVCCILADNKNKIGRIILPNAA